MSDPFDRMKRLVDEGPPLVPLPPHEVRRWGDRIRRRRTAWGAIGVATAVAVVASGGFFVSQEVAGTGPQVDTASQAPSPIRGSELPAETEPPAPSPEGGWRTEIPVGFPLEAGLPEPGGDVPAWSVSHDVRESWRNLPCPTDRDGFETTLPQDSRRTDARTIIAEPPAAVDSRQLALFVDESTAMAAVESIRAVAASCEPVEGRGSTELRYTVSDVAFGESRGFLIAGGEYLSDNDSRVPGRALHSVVRVGNAVFVGGLSDESGAEPLDLSDPGASNLQRATTQIAGAMCVFAADPCPRFTASAERSPSASQAPSPAEPAQPSAAEPEAPSPSAPEDPVHTVPVDPGPAAQQVLGAENLVSAGDLPDLGDERRWRAVAPQSAPTLSCQAEWLSALEADELLYREFRTPPHRRSDYSTAAINTAVAAFDSQAAASAAYTTVLSWVQDCDHRLDNSRPVAYNGEESIRPRINGGRATWRNVQLHATDVCEECDAIWFDRQGVAQVGERLMLVSLTKLGGPLEPRGLNAAMNQTLRVVVQTGRS